MGGRCFRVVGCGRDAPVPSPSPSLPPAGTLLAELREYNLEQQRRAQAEAPSPEGPPEEQPPSARLKGKMQSR